MPLQTAFHKRTSNLNQNHDWRDWSGYIAASQYESYHEREYFGIRNSAALLDVSPLRKYEVSGPDASRLVNRVMTRDMRRCRVGQVFYSPWCDDGGKLVDDGTISRLEEQRYRITAADPSLRWFQDCGFGMDVQVKDVTEAISALALQGPSSRAILSQLVKDTEAFEALRFYRLLDTEIDGFPLTITRTGYTGDQGYEIWVKSRYALRLWDAINTAGTPYGLIPAGLAALDVARIEAGLPLIEVDYISSPWTFIEAQKTAPDELGLGWAVKLVPGNDFIGRKAIEAERKRGSVWSYIGVEVSWPSLEAIFAEADLPPQVTGQASRDAAPVYAGSRQAGQITSHTFSPILKKYIGLGTVYREFGQPGTVLEMEFTVEFVRKRASARVVKLPFYNPPHKRA
jgi:aminomethyltransferase